MSGLGPVKSFFRSAKFQVFNNASQVKCGNTPKAPTTEELIAKFITTPPNFASVGKGGLNREADVAYVRAMLAKVYPDNGALVREAFNAAGDMPVLLAAIAKFQADSKMPIIDGKISAPTSNGSGAPTLKALREGTRTALTAQAHGSEGAAAAQKKANAARTTKQVEGKVGERPASVEAPPKNDMRFVPPAHQRAEKIYNEEILGGAKDISSAWNGNGNVSTAIQGTGEILGGGVRFAAMAFSYPFSFVGQVAKVGRDECKTLVVSEWRKGGFGHRALAVLLAIPTAVLFALNLVFEAASVVIDTIAKFVGESIVEGAFDWLGRQLGGKKKNTSDLRTELREKKEAEADAVEEEKRKADEAAASVQRASDHKKAAEAKGARDARTSQVRAREKVIAGVKSDIKQRQDSIQQLSASESSLSGTEKALLADYKAELVQLNARKVQLETELEKFKNTDLPAPKATATKSPANLH